MPTYTGQQFIPSSDFFSKLVELKSKVTSMEEYWDGIKKLDPTPAQKRMARTFAESVYLKLTWASLIGQLN